MYLLVPVGLDQLQPTNCYTITHATIKLVISILIDSLDFGILSPQST